MGWRAATAKEVRIVADSPTPSSRVELVAAIVLAVIEIGSAIAELKFDVRPRGWLPVFLVFLALFIPTVALGLTAFFYRGALSKIFTVPLAVVGVGASMFFFPIWTILLFCNLTHQQPEPNGDELTNHPVTRIQVNRDDDQTADYSFTFDREADYAEVFVRPDPGVKDRVKKIEISLFKSGSQDVKDRFRSHPLSPTEIRFDVNHPSQTLTATVKIHVIGETNTQPPVALLATYTYRRQNRWWRLRRWVYREFDRQ